MADPLDLLLQGTGDGEGAGVPVAAASGVTSGVLSPAGVAWATTGALGAGT